MSDVNYLEDELALAEEPERRSRGISAAAVLDAIRVNVASILLTILAVGIGYFLLAMTYTLMQPVARHSTLGFRLEFPGADAGEYPNGLKFSGGDIIDTPVLRGVFDANQLGRFMSFGDFSRSVVVLEANAALDALAREYEAKLANTRLTAVERDRLEAQYEQKRASLRKNEYSLNLTTREGITRVPASVTAKVLPDILRAWADFAANTRQVLLYRVPLVSQQAVARHANPPNDLLVSLLSLRATAGELHENLLALSKLPGSEVIRAGERRVSLAELDLELTQLQRGGVEYLIATALRTGAVDRASAIAVLEAQLAYDARALTAAEDRVQVLRTTLDDYLRKTTEAPKAPAVDRMEPGPSEENIVISDSFLDRLVAISQNASDLEFRQRYVDDIRAAALVAVPLRATVDYERRLLEDIRSGSQGSAASIADLRARHTVVVRNLQQIAADLEQIRAVLSRSLTTSNQMYTVTGPTITVAERGVSMAKLAGGGIVVVILAAILAVLAAVVREQFLRGRTATA